MRQNPQIQPAPFQIAQQASIVLSWRRGQVIESAYIAGFCRPQWLRSRSRTFRRVMIGSMSSSWMAHPTHGALVASNADLTHSSGPPNLLSTAAMMFGTIMITVSAHMTTTVETSVNDCHSRRGDGSDKRGTRHWDLRQKRSEPFVSPLGPIDP